ncbi:unnamed protein product [Porites lobata]|uniref:Ribosomal protein L5 n=1 Tax=Porites lobata TaxID=104759 RepID=A0ABN8NXF2_9CNID|nr:unnamed protein product [Porites lobata]
MERESSKECSDFFLWRKGSFSSRNRPSRNSTLFSSRRSPCISLLSRGSTRHRFEVTTSRSREDISGFHNITFGQGVVVSKGTETNKFFGFPTLSLCNLNAFNTRRFRDLYNGSSNGPFIDRYIKDISLMATKSEEILTKEFKSRNIGPFYRFQTPDQTLGVKGIMSHQVAEMLLPSKSRSSIHAL